MTSASDSTSRRPRRLAALCKLLATVFLFGLISIVLEPARVGALLAGVRPSSLAMVVGLSILGLALQWMRWQLLLASVRPQTDRRESLISLLVGFALGMVSPGRVGEIGRGVIFPAQARAACVGAATGDRLCAAGITVGVGLLALVLLSPVHGLAAGAVLGVVILVASRFSAHGRVRGFLSGSAFAHHRVGVFLAAALGAMRQLPTAAWLRALGLSLLFQAVLCTQFYLLATDWMASSGELVLAIPVIFAAKALLPIAFLDLGVREAASVLVFAKLGYDPAVGFNCALLLFAINVVIPAAVGAILFVLAVGRRGAERPVSSRRSTLVLVLAVTAAVPAEVRGQSSEPSPADPAEGVPPMVRLVGEGDALAERGQIEAAIAKYEQARTLGAGSAYVLNRLAQLYMISGHPVDAIALLELSLRESPRQLPVYSMLGESFLATGQIDSALHYVSEARALAPEVSSIRSYLGLLYLQAGRPEKAKAQLDSAVTLDRRNAEAYRFLGLYHTQRDSLERAISLYERVIELQPRDVEAHNNIAFLHSRQQRYRQALDYYRRTKSLTADPNILHSINLNMEAVRAIMNGKMRARYILVDTAAQGRDLLKRLQEGEDFATLAAQFSRAPNASVGGDLGFFGPGDMLMEVEEAVLQLKVGTVSDLIRIQQGVMILQRLN